MKTFTSRTTFSFLSGFLFTLMLSVITVQSFAFPVMPGIVIHVYNTTTNVTPQVEYASLTATATEKSVFISWVTSSEQNNSHFEVERSADMNSFKTVAMVLDGFGTNGTGKSYKFKEDAGAVKQGKTMYYRLKQIDTNNEVHYSVIMAVNLNAKITVFPKPEAVQVNAANHGIITANAGDEKNLSKQSVAVMGL